MHTPRRPRSASRPSAGFALVLALTLMAFVVLLLVSLTSLVRVESASAETAQQRLRARQNALLALGQAIGELQKTAGPDRRVTLASDLFTPVAEGEWTGVFGSVDSQAVLAGTVSEPPPPIGRDLDDDAVAGRLEGWLVSSPEGTVPDPENALTEAGSIRLGRFFESDGNAVDVRAPKVDLAAPSDGDADGAIAWWVADESLKGRVDLTEPGSFASVGGPDEDRATRFLLPQRSDLRIFGELAGLAEDLDPAEPETIRFLDRLIDLEWLAEIGGDSGGGPDPGLAEWLRDHFLDLTLVSATLPVDVAAGGLKQDLSAYLEGEVGALADGDPIFPETLIAGDDLPTFGLIKDWYQAGQGADLPVGGRDIALGDHGFSPVILRAGVWFKPAYDEGTGEVILKIHPYVTLWNPYDRPLAASDYVFMVDAPLQPVLERARTPDESGGTKYGAYLHGGGPQDNPQDGISTDADDPSVLEPEEVFQLIAPGGGEVVSANQNFDLRGWLRLDADDSGSGIEPSRGGQHGFKPLAFVLSAPRIGAGETLLFSADTDAYGEPYDNADAIEGILSGTNRMAPGKREFDHFTVRTGYFLREGPDGTGPPPNSGAIEGAPNTGLVTEFYTRTAPGLSNRQRDFSQRLYKASGGIELLQAFDSEEEGSVGGLHLPWFDQMGSHPWQAVPKAMHAYASSAELNTGDLYARGHNSSPFHMLFDKDRRDEAKRGLRLNMRARRHFTPILDSSSDDYFRLVQFSSNGIPVGASYTSPQTPGNPGAWVPGGGAWQTPLTVQGNDGMHAFFHVHTYLDHGANFAFYHAAPRERPLLSLGELQDVDFSRYHWEPPSTFAQSEAFPFVAREAVGGFFDGGGDGFLQPDNPYVGDTPYLDLSYLLNAALWDRFFLSTHRPGDPLPTGDTSFANARLALADRPAGATSPWEDAEEQFERAASELFVEGALNVNSTSKAAWKLLLSGTLGRRVPSLAGAESNEEDRVPFAWTEAPVYAEDAETDPSRPAPWGSVHSLTTEEIDLLAEAIVREVRLRGPFFSLADFVNRRLAPDASDPDADFVGLDGPLQAALDRLTLEAWRAGEDRFNARHYTFPPGDSTPDRGFEAGELSNALSPEQKEHMSGLPEGEYTTRYAGGPAWLDQGDLLSAIGPFLTARGDTFTIRAAGEAFDRASGEPQATAYCEAVVQRRAIPVEPGDDLVRPTGTFGRKFVVKSFRWLEEADLRTAPFETTPVP